MPLFDQHSVLIFQSAFNAFIHSAFCADFQSAFGADFSISIWCRFCLYCQGE
jgi:hypothetical protein